MIDQCIRLAEKSGWKFIEHKNFSSMISFIKGDSRINVYYTKRGELTVGTCINHPKQGRTQLFRRNITINALSKIFANPRIHTGRGYYTR